MLRAVARSLSLPTRRVLATARCARPFSTAVVHEDFGHATLTEQDVQHFTSIVGPTNVITSESDLATYNTDWMHKYQGFSKLALRPGSTQEVSEILAHCNSRRLAVVPQGGNTGLVGGSVPVNDEIVLSLSRMNKIIEVDENAGTLICEAGCILETLQEHVWAKGYTMPLDLGAKGSCQIGGNVATNAGGLRFIRYGSLHGSVLGVEAVLADGTILDNLTALRKDNTGYDIKQLMIGSEGTLGIVTGCALALPQAPASVQLAFLGIDSYEQVLHAFAAAKKHLGEVLSAIEFFDLASHQLFNAHNEGDRPPLETETQQYMLIELSGSNAEHDTAKLEAFLEHVMEEGIVADGTIAQDSTQSAQIWKIREGITEALGKSGMVYKYDISLPLDQLYDIVGVMRERLEPLGALVNGFGHLGDGNIHLNIHTPDVFTQTDAVTQAIEPFLYEWIAERRGSISAEHGVGVMKPRFLHMSKSLPMIDVMRGIKQNLDPHNILNPHKVLPPRPSA